MSAAEEDEPASPWTASPPPAPEEEEREAAEKANTPAPEDEGTSRTDPKEEEPTSEQTPQAESKQDDSSKGDVPKSGESKAEEEDPASEQTPQQAASKEQEEESPQGDVPKSEESKAEEPVKQEPKPEKESKSDVKEAEVKETPKKTEKKEEPNASRNGSATKTRREQQAQMRSEARNNADKSPQQKKTETPRRRTTPQNNAQSSPENKRSGETKQTPQKEQQQQQQSNGAGGDSPASASSPNKRPTPYYDQRKELQSLQGQVGNLQDAIRARDKDYKNQLLERDSKIEKLRADLQYKTEQYHTERDNHETMRATVNQLHRKLKLEEARRVEDISKDLELSDMRRTVADLKSQLATSGPNKKSENPWLGEGDQNGEEGATPATTGPGSSVFKSQREKLFEERELKMKVQVEMQQIRIDELENTQETQERAIADLQDTLKRYQADDKPPELRKAVKVGHLDTEKVQRRTVAAQPASSSVVPIRYRKETPPKRSASSGSTTPRNGVPNGSESYQRKPSDPTHHSRGLTPVGTTRGSPRRTTTTGAAAGGSEGTATKRTTSTSRTVSAQSAGAHNTSTTTNRTQASSAVDTSAAPPKGITRASPSRVKQFVQQSSFAKMTATQAEREKLTKPATSASLSSGARRTQSPGGPYAATRGPQALPAVNVAPVVVRPTNVSAVKSERPCTTGKFPTTFHPTRLVRHGAWEQPQSGGTQGF